MFAFLRQVFRISDPDTGFAGTGFLIVPQFLVQ